ncbi:sensor histidine kinase [Paenibacillus sp. HW567]|uniref:sensor histidine kinase n=1 Tax=Paenibacillus sp. HW567 TaxID=1034769 RepID=UPI000369BF5F|nr:HAMP domain-containing sensor histidine kinase [Paenibacillus sp. HW567]
MRRFNVLILWTVLIGLGLIAACTAYTAYLGNAQTDRRYRTEINRILKQVSEGVHLNDIVLHPGKPGAVRTLDWIGTKAEPLRIGQFFDGAGLKDREEFTVKPVYVGQVLSGYLRFSYLPVKDTAKVIIFESLILLLALGGIVGLLLYVKLQIIKPFHTIEALPYELSKGHLNRGMKENQSRFFGKFIWGLDLLRETLESQKMTNLSLEKDRQTLVASLSHELKTPVAAIKLYSSALVEEIYESEDKRKACARLIGQKAEHIETLIGEIITASVSSLQNIEVKQGEFYLGDWLKRLLPAHKERLHLLKINLEVGEFAEKLLLGDSDKLLEVMDNLIENAIKYGDGGCIRISFQEEDMRQLIVVENSGIPLAAGELPYIFTSFWRGSNTEGKKGNGLGLYICKQLLQKMGGDIYAEATLQSMRFVLVLRY